MMLMLMMQCIRETKHQWCYSGMIHGWLHTYIFGSSSCRQLRDERTRNNYVPLQFLPLRQRISFPISSPLIPRAWCILLLELKELTGETISRRWDRTNYYSNSNERIIADKINCWFRLHLLCQQCGWRWQIQTRKSVTAPPPSAVCRQLQTPSQCQCWPSRAVLLALMSF